MEFARLVEALADPAAYPDPVEAVEVRHTHISAVFLAGPFAYKIKKPVTLPFLDFGTIAKRLHDCQEELRLNRRLAPDVYLDLVAVAQTPSGPRFEGTGEPIFSSKRSKNRKLTDIAVRGEGHLRVNPLQRFLRAARVVPHCCDADCPCRDLDRKLIEVRRAEHGRDSSQYAECALRS